LAPRFRSTIPSGARPKVVARFSSGAPRRIEFWLRRKIVGYRSLHESGEVEFDYSIQNGLRDGLEWRFDLPGVLVSLIPYRNGREHGTAKQYDDNGKLIGTYRMVHGTGIDLWRSTNFDDGSIILSEVHYLKEGTPHGFEWWINDDQSSVYEEKHWRNGCLHGIERQWNSNGKLRHGYPKYYVDDQKVTKRQYIRAAERDPTLPRWRKSENFPLRRFPAEITSHLGRRRKGA
jgi:antitoxin component YwqK of YwqJK toxin-antitoxin module